MHGNELHNCSKALQRALVIRGYICALLVCLYIVFDFQDDNLILYAQEVSTHFI